MTILLTGGSGFLGSQAKSTIAWYKSEGWQ